MRRTPVCDVLGIEVPIVQGPLGGPWEQQMALVAAVTQDLTSRVHAGKIIGEIAKLVGGRGGGKPDLAQAGGSDAGKLDEALESVYRLIS